ncbi:hypothetical protein G6F59_017279 [Rhizopus arrhizus]|nr:hypothetical protein G6F59_017279 [Rhizopus arrhizus]
MRCRWRWCSRGCRRSPAAASTCAVMSAWTRRSARAAMPGKAMWKRARRKAACAWARTAPRWAMRPVASWCAMTSSR